MQTDRKPFTYSIDVLRHRGTKGRNARILPCNGRGSQETNSAKVENPHDMCVLGPVLRVRPSVCFAQVAGQQAAAPKLGKCDKTTQLLRAKKGVKRGKGRIAANERLKHTK